MDRRDFLAKCALIAAGSIAADQLDILDRLFWRRKSFPSAALVRPVTATEVLARIEEVNKSCSLGFRVSQEMIEDDLYGASMIEAMKDYRETGAGKILLRSPLSFFK